MAVDGRKSAARGNFGACRAQNELCFIRNGLTVKSLHGIGFAIFALSSSASFFLCGCSKPASQSGAASFKVALLTTGPINDGGWNQSAYEGLQKIKQDLGAQVSNEVTDNPSEFESAFQDYASKGYNVIFAHGDEYGDTAAKMAPQFPNTVFITTGGTQSAKNLAPIIFATEDGTYIQGMEAGFISKTGKGGFVGGQSLPPVTRAADAFQNGALAANPHFDFKITYINSWDDVQKAKGQTDELISNGADVIAHNCDAAAKGLFESTAAKPGVYAFGVNSNQNDESPNIISSAFLDIPKAFDDVAKSVKDGDFKGQTLNLGMKDSDVTVIDNPKFASLYTPDQSAKIKQAEADIISGKLKPL
jgi:basic membrane lipoprotein Med (substrate-binding protein (PBP1-ABC) superfamily)